MYIDIIIKILEIVTTKDYRQDKDNKGLLPTLKGRPSSVQNEIKLYLQIYIPVTRAESNARSKKTSATWKLRPRPHNK